MDSYLSRNNYVILSMQFPGSISSKFPQMATTIFTKMSALAAEHKAINLSQGFPDFIVPSVSLTQIQQLIPTALAIAFIGFIESIAVAKKMARENRYELEPNKELIGLGIPPQIEVTKDLDHGQQHYVFKPHCSIRVFF